MTAQTTHDYRQCGEGDGPAFAQLVTESSGDSDYAVNVYYVCRDHLTTVLAAMVEDGDVVEVQAVTA